MPTWPIFPPMTLANFVADGNIKDRVQVYGMAEEWYRYRDAALREIAMAWCEAHGIAYTE